MSRIAYQAGEISRWISQIASQPRMFDIRGCGLLAFQLVRWSYFNFGFEPSLRSFRFFEVVRVPNMWCRLAIANTVTPDVLSSAAFHNLWWQNFYGAVISVLWHPYFLGCAGFERMFAHWRALQVFHESL